MVGFDKKTAKEISKWLSKNGFDVKVKTNRFEFFYDEEYNLISLPRFYKDKDYDPYFMKTLENLGLKDNTVNVLVLSILHEVGHFKTLKRMSEMEKLGAFFDKTLLEENFKNFTVETYLNAYWKVSDENKANKWAVRFANRNPQKVKELEEIILAN